MNCDPETLHDVAEGLTVLDFSEENERIAELTAKISHAEGVMEGTRKRLSEVRGLISDNRGPKGFDVAARLLEGEAPSDAALATPSVEALENERVALQAGLVDIHWQVKGWQGRIQETRHDVEARLRECAQPLVDELMNGAREAAERILECYAGLQALRFATSAGFRADELKAVQSVVEGATVDHGLLARRRDVEVPREVAAALRSLAGKGAAVQARLIDRATIF